MSIDEPPRLLIPCFFVVLRLSESLCPSTFSYIFSLKDHQCSFSPVVSGKVSLGTKSPSLDYTLTLTHTRNSTPSSSYLKQIICI